MFVNFAWIIFRAESIGQAGEVIKKILFFDSLSIRDEFVKCFELPEFIYLREHVGLMKVYCYKTWGAPMWIFLIGAFFIVLNFKNSSEIEFRPTLRKAFTTIVLLVWSVMSLSGVSTFLYFNF